MRKRKLSVFYILLICLLLLSGCGLRRQAENLTVSPTPAVTAATFPSPSADPSSTPAVSPVVKAPAVDVQPDPGNPANVQTDIRRILIPALLGLLMIGIGIGALNARRRKKRAEAARRAGIRNRRPAGSAFRNNTKDSDEDP